MADIKFDGLKKYQDLIKGFELKLEPIIKMAVYDGAAIIADAVKAATPVDTGDLRDSLGLAPMRNDDGYINTKLGFDGYDSKGVPNPLKANVIESGTSKHPKHPFVRPTVNAKKAAAEAAMQQTLDREIEKMFK